MGTIKNIILFFSFFLFGYKSFAQIHTEKLDLKTLENGKIHELWVKVHEDGSGRAVEVPVIIYKGKKKGPVLGITAAIHGNELNGIAVIHTLKNKLPSPAEMKGIIVMFPGLNGAGIQANTREFNDLQDLNRLFPGKKEGAESQQYVYQLYHRLFTELDFLVDLHTASFGRTNTFYVRADLTNDTLRTMAKLQPADVILDSDGAPSASNSGSGETLRAWTHRNGTPGITIELGDPQIFQPEMISGGVAGILNILGYLQIIKHNILSFPPAIICSKSKWLYTDSGGFLYDVPQLGEIVEKGDTIGVLKDTFGNVKVIYKAPERGVVIGRSSNPVAESGARIIHLGQMVE